MFAWIKKIFGGSGSTPELSLRVTADHVELSTRHLIIGLHLAWHNRTANPIPIQEIQVVLYHHGRKEEPLVLYPLERFERQAGRKRIQKMPVQPFSFPPHGSYTESLRFICQEVFDLPPGNYSTDVQVIDTQEICYTNQITLHLPSRIKYRHSEEWETTQN